MAGLLALVADTLTAGLGAAVARDVANLTTYKVHARLADHLRRLEFKEYSQL